MPPPVSRTKERLGGVLLLIVGVWLTVFGWRVVAEQGWFNVAGSAMGPASIVMGLALLAFPGYRSERAARGEDPEALQGWAMLTPRWKGVTVAALGLGLLNIAAMYFGVSPVL